MIAVCQICGCMKHAAVSVCVECGHDPLTSDEETVEAVYLSSGRYEDHNAIAAYEAELPSVGRAIGDGKPVNFDAQDLDRLRVQKETIESIPPSAPWIAVAKLVAPGILFLMFLYGILVLLGHL